MSFTKPFVIIAGVGPGTGRSCALKFASAYTIVLLSRRAASYEPVLSDITKAGGQAIGIATDISDEESIKSAFAVIEKKLPDSRLAVAILNVAGVLVRKPFLELSAEEFSSGFKYNGLGAFLFCQAVMPMLLDSIDQLQYPPTLLVTGATAAIRGSPNFAQWATANFSKRALSQSLAREFGPKGIHVAHAIIDGVIDLEAYKKMVINDGKPDGKLSPEGIAEAYWYLHQQPRANFTFELDMRPYVERW